MLKTLAKEYAFIQIRNNYRFQDYIEILSSEPGIILTSTKKHHGKFIISGIRDPLSKDPVIALKETKLDPEKVIMQWNMYRALDQEIILLRVKEILKPPDTVLLKYENGTLFAEGAASHQWVAEAHLLIRTFHEISQFDVLKLTDIDYKKFNMLKDSIESQIILYIVGTTELTPGQMDIIDKFMSDLKELLEIARNLDEKVHVSVIGHTDNTGLDTTNARLSQERAEQFVNLLVSQGLNRDHFTPIGVGASNPLREEDTKENRKYNRRVSFKVIIP